ncbi:hypothetical protein [Stieleria neptunia]|uniref:hypothetical protein n=1 Tax=Stieleria neptunia TaxID=2527979 RepID=UPI0011AAF226|nr:hypothetical protein [Stieleria neptunia]
MDNDHRPLHALAKSIARKKRTYDDSQGHPIDLGRELVVDEPKSNQEKRRPPSIVPRLNPTYVGQTLECRAGVLAVQHKVDPACSCQK